MSGLSLDHRSISRDEPFAAPAGHFGLSTISIGLLVFLAAHHADALALVVGLDMAEWWAPTRESYLAHVSKAHILEAVREGVSDKDADGLAGLKKDAMVEHAERLLSGRRWLPAVLRGDPDTVAQSGAAAE